MNTFTINSKVITAKPITFNVVCDFERMGIALEELADKKFSLVQAYTAICLGCSLEEAGNQINTDPNAMEGIMIAFGKEVDESDFFRTLSKGAEKETPKVERKK